MSGQASRQYILGIDLGSASLGWALIDIPDGRPSAVLAAGVRVFDPGVDGDIDSGQDESRNKVRRDARLQRRQFRRRADRAKELFSELQNAGLLPPATSSAPKNHGVLRETVLGELDRNLRQDWATKRTERERQATQPPAMDHVLPYFLRARALDQRLEPYEVGRALYHLGQRRGFKSNRKSQPKKDEKPGEVKAAITQLGAEMQDAGMRTLGEYFARLEPEQRRIRGRWTDRKWFEQEFEQIWGAQTPHHPQILTENLKNRIKEIMFFQRPLKWKRSTIGECELERGRRRAPWACLEAQRFRLLQKLNDLRIQRNGVDHRGPSAEERARILAALEEGDQKFVPLRNKLLGLARAEKFNHEEGGEKVMRGDRTGSLMRRCFGDRWQKLPEAERDRIVEEWRTIEEPEAVKRRAMKAWGLGEQEAKELSETSAEDGYCNLSRQALSKILPHMENGTPFKTVEREIYGERFRGRAASDFLPPVKKAESLTALRNPAVERALTECRKVVNAIIRRYGKPSIVRVELARDLRNPRWLREKMSKDNRSRQTTRQGAIAALKDLGITHPSRADIEKELLWMECGGRCPYTDKPIRPADLFGEAPQFDVDHILPLSRFPDDSFQNKTLCYGEENRNRKRGRTPFEAYGSDPERWAQILESVRRFNNPHKLERFRRPETSVDKLLADFSERQLNDTRYTSTLAQKYLGELYGGRDVEEHGKTRRVIQASQGQVTATLRRAWKLEGILGSGEGKGRDDHRHHAVDAIVTGLTEYSWVKQLSERAAYATQKYGRPSFGGLQAPWPGFVDGVRKVIEEIRVSHRPEHKLNGQLHEETNYGPPYELGLGRKTKTFVSVRKALAAIKESDIERIVDPAVKAAVQKRLEELGGDIKKLQDSVERESVPAKALEPPFLLAEDGRRIPIRKVRLRQALEVTPIGSEARRRYVKLGSNHHAEIVALVDEQGIEKEWESNVVSRLEAMQRKRKGQPVVQREHGPGKVFKFSLMGGDLVELEMDGSRTAYVVRTIAESGQFAMVRINDARRLKDMRQEKKDTKDASVFLQPVADTLRRCRCRKVVVELLGELREAHD